MQFTDLNPELTPFQRRYVAYVKRCDEIERKIRYLHGETKSLDIPIKPAGEVIDFIESPTGNKTLYCCFLRCFFPSINIFMSSKFSGLFILFN